MYTYICIYTYTVLTKLPPSLSPSLALSLSISLKAGQQPSLDAPLTAAPPGRTCLAAHCERAARG